MKRYTIIVLVVAAALAIGSAALAEQKIEGRNVEYSAGGVTLKGYLAYSSSIEGKRPGILIVHEWWGQNEYMRKRAVIPFKKTETGPFSKKSKIMPNFGDFCHEK